MKYKIYLLLKIFISVVFIFSAITKLFPIELFELTIVNQGITNWSFVPFLSRAIIGIELALGILLLQKNYVRTVLIPFASLLLIVFTIHLSLTIFQNKDITNCGCFGEIFPMTPLQAIIKNIIFLIILIGLFFMNIKEEKKIIKPFLLFVISMTLIFVYSPIRSYKKINEEKLVKTNQTANEINDSIKQPDSTLKEIKNNSTTEKFEKKKQVDTLVKVNNLSTYKKRTSIFSDYKEFNGKKINLDEGIKLVALFSLECDDCKSKAKEMSFYYKKKKDLPLYILFWGEEKLLNDFFAFAGKQFPYRIIEAQEFFPLIKDHPPRICLLVNGNIISDWTSETFSINELDKKLKSIK